MAAGVSFNFSNITLEAAKEVHYRGAKDAYQRKYPDFEEASGELGRFENQVEKRGSELQNSRVTIPSTEELLNEAVGFVEKYRQLEELAVKATMLANELKEVIQFLQPKPRLWADQQMIQKCSSDFQEAVERTDKKSQEYIKTLSDAWGKIETLRIKMMQQLQGPTAWSLQRFCQIVDNNGYPIGLWTRALDSCTTPVVPEAADLKKKLEDLTKEKQPQIEPSGEKSSEPADSQIADLKVKSEALTIGEQEEGQKTQSA